MLGGPLQCIRRWNFEFDFVTRDGSANLDICHVFVVDGEPDDFRVCEGLNEIDLGCHRRHGHQVVVAQMGSRRRMLKHNPMGLAAPEDKT